MRILALAILAITAVSVAGPARAQTYDPHYPVCLHVYGPVSYYECNYMTLAQCGGTATSNNERGICFGGSSPTNDAGNFSKMMDCRIEPGNNGFVIVRHRLRTTPARPPCRPPATPGGPYGPRAPCYGWRSASPPIT